MCECACTHVCVCTCESMRVHVRRCVHVVSDSGCIWGAGFSHEGPYVLSLGILRILKKNDKIVTVQLPAVWFGANLRPFPGPWVSPLCLEPSLGPCSYKTLHFQTPAFRRREWTPTAAAARKLLGPSPAEKRLSVLQHADGQLRVTRAGQHGLLQHHQQPRLLILQLERAAGTGPSPGASGDIDPPVTNVRDPG